MKWILRYFRGTSNVKLCFESGKLVLTSYIDADMAGDVHTKKSTSCYLINFVGGAVSWQSKMQK